MEVLGFQPEMPQFRDPQGEVWIWDAGSKTYTKTQAGDNSPDWQHASGGDNDLFDSATQTETGGNPLMEGYMASAPSSVVCPNCHEETSERACAQCNKDLTPEWNQDEDRRHELGLDQHPPQIKHYDGMPERVEKPNWDHRDNSFPSMLSRLRDRFANDEEWQNFLTQGPGKHEIGKYIQDRAGQLHFMHGPDAEHELISNRDDLPRPHWGSLGSIYNDGTADVQRVYPNHPHDHEGLQAQIQQAFGPVELQQPTQHVSPSKGHAFEPFVIQGGQWIMPMQHTPLTGLAYVGDHPNGGEMDGTKILVVEHLTPDDYALWHNGARAIITATGGAYSHAAYLASTQGIPVIVGIGAEYNKIESGNYLKIDPTTQTVTVLPAATGASSPEQKQDAWDSILKHQQGVENNMQPTPTFAHIQEETAWREAHAPTLDSCPQGCGPLMATSNEKVCHTCGTRQPILNTTVSGIHQGAPALALAPEIIGAGEAAGAAGAGAAGAEGGGMGMGGMGGLGQAGAGQGIAQVGQQMGQAMQGLNAPVPQAGDAGSDQQGVIAKNVEADGPRFDHFKDRAQDFGQGALQMADAVGGGAAAMRDGFRDTVGLWPDCPQCNQKLKPYGDHSGYETCQCGYDPAQIDRPTHSLGDDGNYVRGDAYHEYQFDPERGRRGSQNSTDDDVGGATKNDGQNSDPDQQSSSGDDQKEFGDSPEQLKDVDGIGMPTQGDHHMQDKALKAFHMNLPLVIEYANSPDSGAENPILKALDELLEQAFPGYKDGLEGHDTPLDEHPEADHGDETDDDHKSEESDPKEASLWHFAYDVAQQQPGAAPAMMGAPAVPGSGAPVSPGIPQQQGVCPSCGMAHLPGTPCPQMPTDPAEMQQQQAPPVPQPGAPSNHVITKWTITNEDSSVQDSAPSQGFDTLSSHFMFSDDDHHEHEHTEHHHHDGDDQAAGDPTDPRDQAQSIDWVDDQGQPLVEGSEYELRTPGNYIPDRVTVTKILPEKIVYTLHSGDVDYQDTLSKQDVANEGYTFSQAGAGSPQGGDSTDGFTGDAPIRPGQDSGAQVDDLSQPSTVVSSLDNYTGSFQGDDPDARGWLNEGEAIAVDPGLLAKLAGKDYSPREQREFIEENGVARNLSKLDLEGTHYPDLDGINTVDTLW